MKSSLRHQAVLAAASLGLVFISTACAGISFSVEGDPAQSDISKSVADNTLQVTNTGTNTVVSTTAIASTALTSTNQANVFTYSKNNRAKGSQIGTLRMSNQTNQPVRIALLSRKAGTKNITSNPENNLPAHWDFAPQEGSEKGLLLSLPQGKLKLTKGDILVAFAQDGSRRYWGPYVVGETSLPAWDASQKEWQLILGQ
ncbi:hypothetical protein [Calothrix sp. 336/3]|uniref:hypothetical protein n=1 Tax=Calothrix sp. 336/3 TaxID=1337936 RepID=UPI0004E2F219|nr:hypothetical protein [Calothrix sp. 336/3]AKG23078.1 hypothetical protein IJ00_19000 [Calothrix sp. 336/3]